MYEEKNTGDNLPAQIDLYATKGAEYKFLFVDQGRRLGQQDHALAGDQGAAQPGHAGEVPGRQDEVPRHRGLPAVPHRGRHRRHLGRGLPEDGQARLHQVLRRPADPGRRGRPGLPRPRAGGRSCSRRPTSSASAPSSAASTSPTTCGWSACRATAPPARSAWASPARPTGTSRPRSTRTGSGSRTWTTIRAASSRPQYKTGKHEHGVRIDLNRPMKEILRRALQAPGLDAAAPLRHAGGGPRHRPRQVQGAHRRRQGGAAVPEGPPGLLRRPGQDPARHALRLLRPDHRRPHGLLRRPAPVPRRLAGHDRQGQPLEAGHRRLPEARRLLPRLHRRPGRGAGRGEHQEGGGHRLPRAGHGGGLEDRGRELPGLHPGGRQGERLLQEARARRKRRETPCRQGPPPASGRGALHIGTRPGKRPVVPARHRGTRGAGPW